MLITICVCGVKLREQIDKIHNTLSTVFTMQLLIVIAAALVGLASCRRGILIINPSRNSPVQLLMADGVTAAATVLPLNMDVGMWACSGLFQLSRDRLLLIDGSDTGATYQIDLCDNTTTAGPQLNVKRAFPASAWLPEQKTVMVCGGSSEGVDEKNCEILKDFGHWSMTRRWSVTTTPMHITRLGFSLTSFADDSLLAVGGLTTPWAGNTSEILSGDKWTYTDEMPMERFYHAGVAVDDQNIMVCGGQNLSSVEYTSTCVVYNKDTKKWSDGPKMNFAREQLGLVNLDGTIYAIGGYADGGQDKKVTNSIERLDAKTNKWVLEETRLPYYASNQCMAVVDSDCL